jgi:hypothetical protein
MAVQKFHFARLELCGRHWLSVEGDRNEEISRFQAVSLDFRVMNTLRVAGWLTDSAVVQ